MITSRVVLGSALCSLLVLACASTTNVAPPRLTSVNAPMYPETEAERALHRGDLSGALATSTREESTTPGDPWTHYDRAVALEAMGRAGEAAREYREAEALFAGRSTWGESISIFGRAHVLAYSGRCADAKGAYEQYATLVRGYAPRDAEMAMHEASECVDPVAPDPVANEVASAVVGGDFARALALAPTHGGGAWVEYNRAIALAAVHRTDDAVDAYRAAERDFGQDHARERAIAIYGRAHALADASRCPEAKRAFQEYAALVRASSPRDADMALAYAGQCGGPYRW